MAKYQLEYGALNELADELLQMDDSFKARIKGVAQEIGERLKANTEKAIPRSVKPTHGVHMADDVVLSVNSGQRKTSITVKGGKRTGSLWFIVDNGHVAQNGRFIPGANFTDKAYNATNVTEPVDSLIQEILKDG